MKEVLIIGAGKRVMGGILPALWCLQKTHRVAGVIARSERHISLMDGRMQITTKTSLDTIDLTRVSVVMVAVPIPEVASVLRMLSRHPLKHATLMLDTPILPFSALASMRFFSRFKDVRASEDVIALPPYLLAKHIAREQNLGAVREAALFHSGYRYHAVAAMRTLADSPVRSIRHTRYPRGVSRKTFQFMSGASGVLYEPRDYERGSFVVRYERGIIADSTYEPATHHIGYVREGAVYRGLTLNDVPVPATGLDIPYLDHIGSSIPEASLMNTMKVRALMELIVCADAQAPWRYPAGRSVVDNALIVGSERLGSAWSGLLY